jgi:LCP family protein required for cell wall assembly
MRFLPRTRGGALWRFMLAAVLVIGFTAATTAVAGLLQVKNLVSDLNLQPALKNLPVKLPNPGEPQTILVIGSDHRAGTPYRYSNTDTMMLIRIDDSSSTINVISIPRDLEVQLPTGGGVTQGYKLNAAYSFGGVRLLINTLKTQVFPGLEVNHVLDVNFGAFEGLVNAIGCVYTDVDHRYYNNTAQTDYSSIDIQPGYQKLCGVQALQFVRFRHTDSDLVRSARQQDFIRWAKDQYSVSRLIANRDKLLRIFGRHVQTDRSLHSIDGLINLFNVVVNGGSQIKQIKFPAQLQPCGGGTGQTPCFVTASSQAEDAVFRQFMTPTAPPATAAGGGSHKRKKAKPSTAGLIADTGDGRSQAAQLGHIPMPVYYPKLILAGSSYCFAITGNCNSYPNPGYEYAHSYPRAYVIHASGGGIYPAYRFTLEINPILGEYYGVQGTTWKHPPILNHPTQVVVVHGKKLFEYFNGHRLSLVAWHTPHAVYWVSNSLTDDILNSQLVSIAASLTRAHG